MAKHSIWFYHDSNAHSSTKMIRLRRKAGLEAVGLFWCVVEMLREASEYKLEIESIDDIAFELRVDTNVFDSLFECGLLEKDDTYFFSSSLINRMGEYDKIKEKRRRAGAKGGKAKASKDVANASQDVANANQNVANANQTNSDAIANSSDKNRLDKNRLDKNRQEIYTNPSLSNQIKNIADVWEETFNSEVLIDKALTNRVTSKLKEYGLEMVLDVIRRYKEVLSSNKYWWSHEYTAFDFFGDGFIKFAHASSDLREFKNGSNGVKNSIESKNIDTGNVDFYSTIEKEIGA